MTSIFISHSTYDKNAAVELSIQLRKWGYETFFLDNEPTNGIFAGEQWENILYEKLRNTQALIFLCSNSSLASKWCFAELTHAKLLGKEIFPVKIATCKPDDGLLRYQMVDLIDDKEAGYRQLRVGLRRIGVDPMDDFSWDRTRNPFPGFEGFNEPDAGIYFGRQKEVNELLSKMNLLRQFSGSKLIAVVGPSGSGKSSFLKAGIIPRLRKEPNRWIILPPFRTGTDPVGNLMAAVDTWNISGEDLFTLKENISRPIHRPDAALNYFIGNIKQIKKSVNNNQLTVVLTIDQLEESLGPAFIIFHQLLAKILSMDQCPVIILASLRSDSLATFQNMPEWRDGPLEKFLLAPMSKASLSYAIEGPAKRAGIQIDTSLVANIIEDCVSGDSLPLLALTLKEMYRRNSRHFTWELYCNELGGMSEVVAKVAQHVINLSDWSGPTGIPLRESFLQLVEINDEGAFIRRSTTFSSLPKEVHAILIKLVDARLLTSQNNMIEVTHEALFRVWQELAEWLAVNREFLEWRRKVNKAIENWNNHDKDPEILLKSKLLVDAEKYLKLHPRIITIEQKGFINVSFQNFNNGRTLGEINRSTQFNLVFRGAAGFGIGMILLYFIYVNFISDLTWFIPEWVIFHFGMLLVGALGGFSLGLGRLSIIGFAIGALMFSIILAFILYLPELISLPLLVLSFAMWGYIGGELARPKKFGKPAALSFLFGGIITILLPFFVQAPGGFADRLSIDMPLYISGDESDFYVMFFNRNWGAFIGPLFYFTIGILFSGAICGLFVAKSARRIYQ